MKRFQNILFYTDGQVGSRFAPHRAVELAKRNQGWLTVVNVLEDLPRELLRLAAAMPSENLQSMAMQERRFDELLGKFTTEDLSPRLHLVKGEAGTLIPHLAAKERVDLIVMDTVGWAGLEGYFIGNTAETVLCTKGRTNLKYMLLGSTVERLLRDVPCSVLTVKPRTEDVRVPLEKGD
jgi:nucleotide-binding universal stress UspA family protein